MNPKLNKDEKKYLSTVCGSLYCQGCRSCVAQCPEHLPIPEMMRAYMYNYGYKSPALAKSVIDELALAENVCNKCVSCSVACPAGFRVAQKVNDVLRLRRVPQEFLV